MASCSLKPCELTARWQLHTEAGGSKIVNSDTYKIQKVDVSELHVDFLMLYIKWETREREFSGVLAFYCICSLLFCYNCLLKDHISAFVYFTSFNA